MNLIEMIWNKLTPRYLGGELLETFGKVRGMPSMGTTADLQKATGELCVHLVAKGGRASSVVIEMPQHELPGDSAEMVCLQLDREQAALLGDMLTRASTQLELRSEAPEPTPSGV